MADIKNPIARSENLLIEDVAGELLIYDVNTNRAHCLNESAAAIWRHCDGSRSVDKLADHVFPTLHASDARQIVDVGLQRLRRRRLVDVPAAAPAVDVSRRQMLKKVAILAATAGIVAPAVSTVIAPTAAYAFSCMPAGFPCTSPFSCCSGLCRNLMCT
jgi:hypothetical protein